jgi:hypothetical protein
VLSPFDDYPLHQVIEPLRIVGTTDRNFYDRYYFNMHTCSDELVMAAGLGCYPNRSVVDAYIAVLYQGTHRVVRASRTLAADRAVTSVGPISIEVVEGLKTLRLRCEPQTGDIALDLTWTGAISAHAEPRHALVRNGRTVIDMFRFTQTGTWQGSITEDSSGRRSHNQAVVVPTDPHAESFGLGTAEHAWTFVSGTRQLSGGVLTFPEAKGELT